ncbi:MAG: Methyltransferase, cyclopropane fatty acid synthase [Candidatus Nomurabacteria bacterium]|nr:Methyltransferase, cyclopropane fatty acid synthase [Candidatus Nomurabacteria bacterium]
MNLKEEAQKILNLADIKIGGDRPWDMIIHDERVYADVLSKGSVALGETYMNSWWDSPALDQFFDKLISANLKEKVRPTFSHLMLYLSAKFFNKQSKKRAFIVGEKHYDAGNDLYTRMLDKRLTYTCGYWKEAKTLDEAQEAKLDLICKKIGLKSGDKVLDIGCGWGSFAKFAAEKYGAHVVGITISNEQAKLARELVVGLPVEIRVCDYREMNEKFDHIISIGMFEHVGYKNFRTYMEVANRCLKDDGLFLLHTIGNNYSDLHTDPWIEKYIFPNGLLPSIAQIGKSIERLFIMEDWHNFGTDYDKTLMVWNENFEKSWDEIKDKYDERFKRMWNYYLLMCAGSFRARDINLWQIVLSKKGVKGGYKSIR